MDFPTLKNAPVQEGLIDLRATFSTVPVERNFQAIAADLTAFYPEAVAIQGAEMQIQISDAGLSQQALTSYRGILLTSKDKGFVFQAQVDGFTLSRLRPYSTWDELFAETKRLWNVYEKHTKPTTVSRIAVRYINSFDLPGPIANLRDYFEAPPELPPKLPQGLSNYLVRYQVPDTETGATVILTQTMEESSNERISFVVDIDAFKLADFDAARQEWWELLSQLRAVKNQVFFASLTEKTLERFR